MEDNLDFSRSFLDLFLNVESVIQVWRNLKNKPGEQIGSVESVSDQRGGISLKATSNYFHAFQNCQRGNNAALLPFHRQFINILITLNFAGLSKVNEALEN